MNDLAARVSAHLGKPVTATASLSGVNLRHGNATLHISVPGTLCPDDCTSVGCGHDVSPRHCALSIEAML